MESLMNLGFSEFFRAQLKLDENTLIPARVIYANRGQYDLMGEFGKLKASLSGRLEYVFVEAADYPVIGDWVMIRHEEGGDHAVIERVLDRGSKISRKQAGRSSGEQLIAANIDYGLIVQSCNADLNPRRLERYLIAVKEGQVEPVLVMSKSDLLKDGEGSTKQELEAFSDTLLHFVSVKEGHNLDQLEPYFKTGKTSVLIGSSGVGKSTLSNAICDESSQKVQEIRDDDDKGRHTTTDRRAFFSRWGGLVIDTPGMREFGLVNVSIEGSGLFDDIDALGENCRYRNCQHNGETGCAVEAAVLSGELDQGRIDSLRKLQKEEAYEARRNNHKAQADEKKRWKEITKQMRHHPKKKRF